jgi:hypothetical protein
MPKLRPRPMPFGQKARAQAAAIASDQAARANETFMKLGARTAREHLDVVLAIFPLGSRWVMRHTADQFRVEEVSEQGDVVMVRESDGRVIEVQPWRAVRSAWERVDV